MKKSTKAILLTAITMTINGLSSCGGYDVYGPAPDINDNSNDVSKSMMFQNIQSDIVFDNDTKEK